MYKYALLFALAGGAALFTGCRADEEVDLAGYPETPVGATISGTTDRVATFAGTYDNEGVLNLAGSLSGEYTIALAQASPKRRSSAWSLLSPTYRPSWSKSARASW